MAAPLLREMATALRKSANTLEVTSTAKGHRQPVVFLDQKIAMEIETDRVDPNTNTFLGDVTQFNKYNGWGKIEIDNNTRTISFNVPSDVLPRLRQRLIISLSRRLTNLLVYCVRDRSGEVVRLIVIDILKTPDE